MRTFLAALTLAIGIMAPAHAQQTAGPATAAPVAYSSSETDVGTLLDDPAAKAIIDKHLPGFSSNPQIEMARAMTLRVIQPYTADMVTDEKLALIDADLAKLRPAR